MTSAAASRARMSRPLDAMRVAAREKVLTGLRDYEPDEYAARCSHQGYPVTTTPSQLARFEVAQEQTVSNLDGGE